MWGGRGGAGGLPDQPGAPTGELGTPGAVSEAAQRRCSPPRPAPPCRAAAYFVDGARQQALEEAAEHHAVLQGGLQESLGVGHRLLGRLQHAQGDQPRNGLLGRSHGRGGEEEDEEEDDEDDDDGERGGDF